MTDYSAPVTAWMPLVTYPGYLPDLPDLRVGRLPAELTAGRPSPWKLWVVETLAETQALDAALARPILTARGLDFSAGPDAAVRANGRRGPFAALYPAQGEGWPWITLVATPGAPASAGLHRQCYAYDTDESEAAALARITRLRLHYPGPIITPAVPH